MGGHTQGRAVRVHATLIAFASLFTPLQLDQACAQDAPPPAAAALVVQEPEAAPPTPAVAAPDAQPETPPPAASAPTGTADRPWRAGMERAPEPVLREAPLRWYGWQTLVVDLLSIAAFAGGVSDPDLSVFTLVGLGGVVFGSPLVHVLNGNGSSAGISLGVRLGSFVLIGIGGIVAVGETLGSDGDSSSFGSALAIVGVAGLALAMVVDTAALAWVRDKTSTERLRTNTAGIQPWLDPQHRRVGLSFVLAM